MRFSVFTAAAALVSAVSADVFPVSVGKDGQKFTPEFVNAKKGDTVMFIFHPKNHTLTQSSFGQPCENYTKGGLDSGFVGYPPNETPKSFKVWNVTVEDEKPKWFSCRQRVNETATHCSNGMVFSINPDNGQTPAGKKTSADGFKQLALASKPTVEAVDGTSSSSSSSSSSSASATDGASKSESTSGSSSSSASDSKSSAGSSSAGSSSAGSSSASGTSSAKSGDAKATDAAGTSSSSSQTDAGKPSLPTSASSSSAASSSAANAPSPSPSNAAGAVARNTAGALTAAGIVLAFVL